jgi:hypothetical protein
MTATIKVLFNDCYGGFNFSEAFLAEYKARTGQTLDTYKALFRRGMNSIRCDPVAIAIVEEKGSEWSSGVCSSLAIREFPAVFDRYWEVEESDGDEHVRIDVAAALADILQTYMETRDLPALERQYTAIMEARVSMTLAPIAEQPANTTPPVLKQEANIPINSHVISYFS